MFRPFRSLFVSVLVLLSLTAGLAYVGYRWYEKQSEWVAGRLAHQVATGTPSEALHAVRQLARLGPRGIDALVQSAQATRTNIAMAARRQLEEMVSRWEAATNGPYRADDLADALERLSASLAGRLHAFAPEGQYWARTLSVRVLHVAGHVPSGRRGQIVANTEYVMENTSSAARFVQAGEYPPPTELPYEVASALRGDGLPLGGRPGAPSDASSTLVSPPLAASENESQSSGQDGGLVASSEASTTADLATMQDSEPLLPVTEAAQELNPMGDASVERSPTHAAGPGSQGMGDRKGLTSAAPALPAYDEGAEQGWLPQWQQAPSETSLRSVPADGTVAGESSPEAGGPFSDEILAAAAALDEVPARELLARLAAADPVGAPTIAHEAAVLRAALRRRGFGTVSREMAITFLSENPDDRLALLEKVASTPGAGPAAWLLLLVEDSDAEVRLSALKLLATSTDRRLIEHAWSITLQDPDPRVARLSQELQARRRALSRE